MFNVRVVYQGDNLINFADKIPQVVNFLLTRLGVEGEGYAKRLTPVDSGGLRRSIKYKRNGANKITIGTNKVYAPYILLNTPPFIVRAKNKKCLAWVTEGHVRPNNPTGWKEAKRRGWARYAKQVTHPGGRDVIGKTKEHLKGQIPGAVRQALNKYGII